MVFGSSRKPARDIDLFIVFRRHGAWGTPIPLGDVVNSAGSDAEARLGPDGTTLYFSSERMMDTKQPRDRHVTQRALDATGAWNNGLYNIWATSLRPWLECMRTVDDDAFETACRKPT